MSRRQQRITSGQSSVGAKISPVDPAVQEAIALFKAGHLSEAGKVARKLMRKHPQNVFLYDIVAFSHLSAGKPADAAACCRKALQIAPGHLGAHSTLALALMKLGQPDNAAVACRNALAIDPAHPTSLNTLGRALAETEDLEGAAEAYRAAIAARPGFAEAHGNLGNVLKRQGRMDDAIASYRTAVSCNPNLPQLHHNLGNALRDIGYLEDAITSYEQALALKPGDPLTLTGLANALSDLGDLDAAIANFEAALDVDPDLAAALTGLGTLYERTNRLDQAITCADRARSTAPDDREVAILSAILLRRRERFDEAIALLEPVADSDLESRQSSVVHNELGKLEDRMHNADAAFRHFELANQAQARAEPQYGIWRERFLDQIAEIDQVLGADWVGTWAPVSAEEENEAPVFLVGFPRSGTTLLDQILDSHPAIQVMEEKPALESVVADARQRLEGYPRSIADIGPQDAGELRDLYHAEVARHLTRRAGTLLVDKMPLQLAQLPFIARLFPTARVVLALRHPCDVVLSNFMQHYRLNNAMANFLTIEDAARCYVRVMSLWQNCVAWLPISAHTVRYEDVVTDFESEIHRLLTYLDIDWDDAVLAFDRHAKAREIINTPSYQSVTEPINRQAMFRWKRYERQLGPVLPDLQPFVSAFGYGDISPVS